MTKTQTNKTSPLPLSLPPRGLSRDESAAYVGIGVTKFDQLVADGRMPRPKMIDGRRVWDRLRLDSCFAALPDVDGGRDDENDDVWSRVAL